MSALPDTSVARLCLAIADQYDLDPFELYDQADEGRRRARVRFPRSTFPDPWIEEAPTTRDAPAPAQLPPLYFAPALRTFTLALDGKHLLMRYVICDACREAYGDDRPVNVTAPMSRTSLIAAAVRCPECGTLYVGAEHLTNTLTAWLNTAGRS